MERETVRFVSFAFVGVAILAVCGSVAIVFFSSGRDSLRGQNSENVSSERAGSISESSTSTEYTFFRTIDGRAVSTSEQVESSVVAVMIDNHPDARPQAGIAEAPVVYEMPVEGAYTRFLAVFPTDQSVDAVGPVRSARPYFIEAAREYAVPLYMHSGGSPEALTLLKSGVVQDANEFAFGAYFVRDPRRNAPHNLFTSSTAWNALLKNVDTAGSATWSGWRFSRYADESAYRSLVPFSGVSSTTVARKAIVRFAGLTGATWTYEDELLAYRRSVRDVVSTDAASTTLRATTILIQYVPVKSIDTEDRKSVGLIGTGRGVAISRGIAVQATWKKAFPTDRTRWYDDRGNELVFIPGTIWVEIVPTSANITIE